LNEEQDKRGDNLSDELQDLEDQAGDIEDPDIDYKALVKQLFPYLPNSLIDAFAEGWAEGGTTEGGLASMRGHAQYQDFFPGNTLSPGVFAMGESEYIQYQNRVRDMVFEYNLPYTSQGVNALVGELVGGQNSVAEVEDRIRKGYVASLQAPQEARDELALMGVGPGDLATFWLDPDKGIDLIQRKWTEAQIRGSSKISGYGQLTASEGERLADLGIDPTQARETFTELARSRGLFSGLIGTEEDDISREAQLGAGFGSDAEDRDLIKRRTQGRQAAFGGGGGAAQTQTGVAGLREAE
jgi:hypothetical protein